MGAQAEKAATAGEQGQDDDASPLELFFDLVFVVSLALLSKYFLKHQTWDGVAETAVLLAAFYAVWSATTFAAMLPEIRRGPAQWVVLAVMLLALVMATAIEEAWKPDDAFWFVVPYLACRTGHAVATLVLNPEPATRAYQQATLLWATASAPLWVAGALTDGHTRLALWGSAAVADLAGAWTAHPAPKRMRRDDLTFDADRLVERCRLFLLVVLGETLLTTGLGLATVKLGPAPLAAGALAFVCVTALWLLYFGSSDHHVERDLDRTGDALRIARRVLASQFVVAAGLVVLAAGLDEVIAHPGKDSSAAVALTLCGGPVLYLLVQAWYLHLVAGGSPWKRMLGAGALVVLCPVLLLLPALAALAAVAAVLTVQAVATLRGPGAVA